MTDVRDPGGIHAEPMGEDGRTVGFRLVDGRGLLWGTGCAQGCAWTVRRIPGGMSLAVEGPSTRPHDDVGVLLMVAGHMRDVRGDVGLARERLMSDLRGTMGPGDGAAVLAAHRATIDGIDAALEVMEPFLGTLDPAAVARCVEGERLPPFDAAAYAALDRTMDGSAPLARALDAYPHLGGEVVSLFGEDPDGFRAMMAGCAGTTLDDALRDAMARKPSGSSRAAGHALEAAAAMRDMDDLQRLEFTSCMEHHAIDDEPAAFAGWLMALLPPSWAPTTPEGWVDWAVCSPATVAAVCEAAPRDRARMLNARGGLARVPGRARAGRGVGSADAREDVPGHRQRLP